MCSEIDGFMDSSFTCMELVPNLFKDLKRKSRVIMNLLQNVCQLASIVLIILEAAEIHYPVMSILLKLTNFRKQSSYSIKAFVGFIKVLLKLRLFLQ